MAQLGYPDHGKYNVEATPYDSKIGGLPKWFRNENPGSTLPYTCTACGAPLFLVAQIYAPVDYARSLAIFGCNRQQCSKLSSTWRVVRTQDKGDGNPWKVAAAAAAAAVTGVVAAEAAAAVTSSSSSSLASMPTTGSTETKTTGTTSDLSFGGGDDGGGWGESGGWGDDSGVATGGFATEAGGFGGESSVSTATSATTTPDLEALLQSRDQSLKNQKNSKGSNQKKKDTPKPAEIPAAPAAAATVPPAPTSTPAPTNASTTTATTTTTTTTTTTAAVFPEMFLYVEVEPEQGSQKVAKDSVERAVQRHMKKHCKTTPTSGSGTAGDGYIQTPPKEKALQHYQQRIVRAPKQCLRYAYNTVPLWPSPMDDMQQHVSQVPSKLNPLVAVIGPPMRWRVQLMCFFFVPISFFDITRLCVWGQKNI